MANKQALRELQSRLAERLSAVKTEPAAPSWLAVECGRRGFLLPLCEAGEIFSLAAWSPVPYSQRWFLGVANLRGHLHGVVDLADFLGLKSVGSKSAGVKSVGVKSADAGREQARLVGFNQGYELNCALLVDRLSGLRGPQELTAVADAGEARPGFVGTCYRDAAGRLWQELKLGELASNEAFLRIVA